MFQSYLLKEQSDRTEILDLEISLHALSFTIIKKNKSTFLMWQYITKIST